jgi:hypothetical protein
MMTVQNMAFDVPASVADLTLERLEEMRDAGQTVREMMRVLGKSGQNLVGQCLSNQGTFYELDHYPKGDVYDSETHSQFYYHAHRADSGEHGHFHTFLRAAGMPDTVKPVPYSGSAKRPEGKDALTHFVAISMDRPGNPIGLFTTNRWVTDETFYKAEDVISLLDRFNMDLSYPCLATNRTLTALFRLFRPQIETLLRERDKAMAQWAARKPGIDIYEDREIEVLSQVAISVDRQIAAVEDALSARRAA